MTRKAPKQPFLKAYAQSWFGDTALRACSMAARGLWWEMCLLMHDQGDPYGHLAANGEPMPDADVAAICAVPLRDYRKLLKELERRDVFSRRANGTIYSRKLVRDAKRRDKAASDGALATLHPNHPKHHRGYVAGTPHPRGSEVGSEVGSAVGSGSRVRSNTRVLEEKTEPDSSLGVVPSPETVARRREVLAAYGKAS